MTTTTAFSWQAAIAATGCAAAEYSQSQPDQSAGRPIRTGFPLFRAPDRQRSSQIARGVTWRYYGSDGPDWTDSRASGIWIAPNSIKHICVAEGGKCTGKEWTNHLEFAPSQVLSDISSPTCNLRGVSWVIPDAFDSDHSWDVRNVSGPSWVANIVNAVGQSTCKTPRRQARIGTSTAIIITWDDWGGWYDHEAPRIEAVPTGRLPDGIPCAADRGVRLHTPPDTSVTFARGLRQRNQVRRAELRDHGGRTDLRRRARRRR